MINFVLLTLNLYSTTEGSRKTGVIKLSQTLGLIWLAVYRRLLSPPGTEVALQRVLGLREAEGNFMGGRRRKDVGHEKGILCDRLFGLARRTDKPLVLGVLGEEVSRVLHGKGVSRHETIDQRMCEFRKQRASILSHIDSSVSL